MAKMQIMLGISTIASAAFVHTSQMYLTNIPTNIVIIARGMEGMKLYVALS